MLYAQAVGSAEVVVGQEVSMTATRRFDLVKIFIVCAEAVLISLALVYLAEYAALPLVREAGGAAL